MPDREKIIKGIESCEPSVFKRVCTNCPYNGDMNCDYVLWHDALLLLKEQDEVIKTLSAFARADGIDVDALLGRTVKWNA